MAKEMLTERAEKIRQVSMAMSTGRLDAILNKKVEIMALKPNELDRIATILGSTKAASNTCCTGG